MTLTATTNTVPEPVPPGVRRIAHVEVEEFRTKGVLYDRRITVEMDCGHRKNVGIRLTAPVPVVGTVSGCLTCRLAGRADG